MLFRSPGTPITIAPNTSTQEQCVIIAVSSDSVKTYFQYDHTDASSLGTQPFVTCSSVVGHPADLCVTAFDSVFVAGDPNNPHVLYQSKNGRPESFPVIELDTGIAKQINVGSPSNPIMAITEFNGQIVCLNLENIYTVPVFLGQMQSPIETTCNRGLYARYAWCKVENEIWFLAYDGIYSWSGGQAVKRSEAIDPLFKGFQCGPYAPIDLTDIPYATGPHGEQYPAAKDIITMVY